MLKKQPSVDEVTADTVVKQSSREADDDLTTPDTLGSIWLESG